MACIMFIPVVLFTVILIGVFAQNNPTRVSIANSLALTGTHVYVLQGNFKDRIDNIKALLINLGLNNEDVASHVTFVKTYTKEELSNNTVKQLIVVDKRFMSEEQYSMYFLGKGKNNLGVLICLLAHLTAYQLFRDSIYNYAMLFEDDAYIPSTNHLRDLHYHNRHVGEWNNTYPTRRSKQFKTYTDIEKSVTLLDKLLYIPSWEWDINYLGFCYEPGNANGHAFKFAKWFYLTHGIDVFLSRYDRAGIRPLDQHFTRDPTVRVEQYRVSEAEADELSHHYFYHEAIFPMCSHSYMVNRRYLRAVLGQLPLNLSHVPHESSDTLMIDTVCSHGLRKIRPVIPLFLQLPYNKSKGRAGQHSYIGHNYDKLSESPRRPLAHEIAKCEAAYNRTAAAALRFADLP